MEPNSSEDVSSNNTIVCPTPTNKKETISKDTVDIQFSIDLRRLDWVELERLKKDEVFKKPANMVTDENIEYVKNYYSKPKLPLFFK